MISTESSDSYFILPSLLCDASSRDMSDMLDDVFGSLEHVPGDSRGLQLDREPAAREPEPRTQLELPRRSPPSSSSKALVALGPCLDFVLQGRDRIYTSSIMTFQSEFWSWMSPSAVKLGIVPAVGEQAPSSQVDLLAHDGRPTIISFLRHCGCPCTCH
jgi:hypothetical protein